MKNNVVRVILAVLSGLILVGGTITAFIFDSQFNHDNIVVHIEDGNEKTLEFKDLSLIPGEEAVYNVSFASRLVKKYHIDLEFVEDKDLMLKDFVRLRIETDGKVISDGLLREYFENGATELELNVSEKERANIKFTYYLPIEVGNEAQCAEAEFSLKITAKHMGDEL